MTTNQNDTVLGAKLREAYANCGKQAPTPPAQTRKLGPVAEQSPLHQSRDHRRNHNQVNGRNAFQRHVRARFAWSSDIFGSCTISCNAQLGAPRKNHPDSRSTWVPLLNGKGQPNVIEVVATVKHHPTVSVLHALGGKVTDVTCGIVPTLSVPVEWRFSEHTGKRAITRQRDADNFDLVFLRKDGMFVQLQVSIVSRNKGFWLCVQEIYGGQIVRTSQAEAAKLELTTHEVQVSAGSLAPSLRALVVPLDDLNAFPGSDYLKTFSNMGPKVIDYANNRGATAPLSECVVADWDPQELDELPDSMQTRGWMRAVVTFFNLVTGWGMAICEDGERCLVAYQAIQLLDATGAQSSAVGKFPVLEPGMGIALKRQPYEKGLKATAILPAPDCFKP